MIAQRCTFCMNPESIITRETCCTGCEKLCEVTGIEPSKEWKEELSKKRQCENNNDIVQLVYIQPSKERIKEAVKKYGNILKEAWFIKDDDVYDNDTNLDHKKHDTNL